MSALSIEDCLNDVCPWTGKPVSAEALTLYKGKVVGFADRAARDAFLLAMIAFETALQPAPVFKYKPLPGQHRPELERCAA